MSAYLRLRPPPPQDDFRTVPIGNVNVLSSTEACMSAPSPESANTMPRSSSMSSFNLAGLAAAGASANPSTVYTFDEVFSDSTSQASLYSKTALPLVSNLLGANDTGRMENALIFTYGVSGGGKTRTSIDRSDIQADHAEVLRSRHRSRYYWGRTRSFTSRSGYGHEQCIWQADSISSPTMPFDQSRDCPSARKDVTWPKDQYLSGRSNSTEDIVERGNCTT